MYEVYCIKLYKMLLPRNIQFWLKKYQQCFRLPQHMPIKDMKTIQVQDLREFVFQHKDGYWINEYGDNCEIPFNDFSLKFGKMLFKQGFVYTPRKIPYNDTILVEVIPEFRNYDHNVLWWPRHRNLQISPEHE